MQGIGIVTLGKIHKVVEGGEPIPGPIQYVTAKEIGVFKSKDKVSIKIVNMDLNIKNKSDKISIRSEKYDIGVISDGRL